MMLRGVFLVGCAQGFENYQRGYFIIDTGTYGLVAVGLSEIGSVVFQDRFLNATGPVPVQFFIPSTTCV